MRVSLDTHIVDWPLARPEEYRTFIAALEGKALESLISVEVEYEIDSALEPRRSALVNLIRSSATERTLTYYAIWSETAIPEFLGARTHRGTITLATPSTRAGLS